jgi:heterodisulfide reductase subunit C
MSWLLPPAEKQLEFVREVQEHGAPNVIACYQCGKCTAGCPVAYEMDYPPNQLIRGISLGMRDTVLSSRSIWLCAACETCSERCPQEVDPAAVMDSLRRIAYAEGIRSPEQDITLFHRIFLGNVKQFGRLFEAGLIGFFNIFSGHYTKDVLMAPKMLLKGKLNVVPSINRKSAQVKEIFAKAKELEAS